MLNTIYVPLPKPMMLNSRATLTMQLTVLAPLPRAITIFFSRAINTVYLAILIPYSYLSTRTYDIRNLSRATHTVKLATLMPLLRTISALHRRPVIAVQLAMLIPLLRTISEYQSRATLTVKLTFEPSSHSPFP